MFTFSLCVCVCVFRTTNYAPWRPLWQKSDLITSNYCLRAPAAPTHPPPPPPHRTRRPSPPATRLLQMASFTHTSSETAFNFHQSVLTLSRAINSPCLIGISCMHSYVLTCDRASGEISSSLPTLFMAFTCTLIIYTVSGVPCM